MSHQLDFIKSGHILKALDKIDKSVVPKDNQWSEYWIRHNSKLYQFKYVVEVASSFIETPIDTTDFTSNDSSRNFISKLGFHILFRSPDTHTSSVNYWIGASYYGLRDNQVDMFDDFFKNKYWRTDHDLSKGEGKRIYNDLKAVKSGDRLGIRYPNKKGGTVDIAAVGTVTDVSQIEDGKLKVNWDYNPPLFKGEKPSGPGSGNWWKTLLQLKRVTDIEKVFFERKIEKRISRLAWNDVGWVMPSGRHGKSSHADSHESRFGYGHEEWLFDVSKTIYGYHYGFLEPVRKEQDAYLGHTYDVWLYSINGETKVRYWIGEIRNLTPISSEEANSTKEIYVQNGWMDEMESQIRSSGANEEGFSNWEGVELFNVKFKPEDIVVNDPYYPLPSSHPIVEQSRYSFARFKENYEIVKQDSDDFQFVSDADNDGDEANPRTRTYQRQPKSVEIVYLHKAISKALSKSLREIYGKKNVTKEHPAGYGANRIDIVVKNQDNFIFYEIKTYNSIKTSIREAFGQLMEYCFFPNKRKASEIIIVTHLPADQDTRDYFNHLREITNLPLHYQSYDLETKTLSEKV